MNKQHTLSGKERRHLTGLGHHLEAIVFIGKAGVSEGVCAALERALADHELVKAKMQDIPGERKACARELADKTQAILLQLVGKTALYFRAKPKESRFALSGEPNKAGAQKPVGVKSAKAGPPGPVRAKSAKAAFKTPGSARSGVAAASGGASKAGPPGPVRAKSAKAAFKTPGAARSGVAAASGPARAKSAKAGPPRTQASEAFAKPALFEETAAVQTPKPRLSKSAELSRKAWLERTSRASKSAASKSAASKSAASKSAAPPGTPTLRAAKPRALKPRPPKKNSPRRRP